MYQIPYQCGLSLVVMGDRARIDDYQGIEQYAGSHERCLEWLRERGINSVSSGIRSDQEPLS